MKNATIILESVESICAPLFAPSSASGCTTLAPAYSSLLTSRAMFYFIIFSPYVTLNESLLLHDALSPRTYHDIRRLPAALSMHHTTEELLSSFW
jgi:hypothetical protein